LLGANTLAYLAIHKLRRKSYYNTGPWFQILVKFEENKIILKALKDEI